jgi:hypothetical protein
MRCRPALAVQSRPSWSPGIVFVALCLCAAALLAGLAPLPAGACKGPFPGPSGLVGKSIEEAFAVQPVWRLDGVDYRISDGIFQALLGMRAWVAVKPRSPSAGAGQQLVLLEDAGGLRCGTLRAIASWYAAAP